MNPDLGFCTLFYNRTKTFCDILDNYAQSKNSSLKNKSNTQIILCNHTKYIRGYVLIIV